MTFARTLVLPSKNHCRILIRMCAMGALTIAPYKAIFGTREVK